MNVDVDLINSSNSREDDYIGSAIILLLVKQVFPDKAEFTDRFKDEHFLGPLGPETP